MKNKKIFLIIGIIVFVNLGLFIYFRFQDQNKFVPSSPTPSASQQLEQLPASVDQSDQSASSGQQPVDQPIVQDLPPADVDQPSTQESGFSISGVLIGDGNPWTLIYDAPGSPAATFELVFTDQSLCDFGQGDTSCTPMYYEVGTGIEVAGQKDGSKLIVSRVERSVPLMGQ